MSTGTDHTTVIMDPRHRGNTRGQKQGSKARILTDPLGFCLGHPKITIKSQNKSTGTDYTTKFMDPRHLDHTRVQKQGTKARILTNPQGFYLGHLKITIKSEN